MPHAIVGRIFTRSLYFTMALALLASAPARAQEPLPPPAYIAMVDGSATLEREGQATPAVANMPLVPGDRVRTESGRVEIRFPDGTGIEVAEFSAVELVTDTRVRLLAGSIDRLEPLQASVNAASASYLPQDLQMYGSTLDQNGTWQYAPDYGYVWYPRVAADWRPYYDGHWEPVRRYGWTWIGAGAWAWPTHHYGRWGYRSGAWFWVPDRTFSAGGFAANRNTLDRRRLPPQTTFAAQPTPAVAVPRAVQPVPIVIPPVASGQPVRAGTTRPAYEPRRETPRPHDQQPKSNDQQSKPNDQQPKPNEQGPKPERAGTAAQPRGGSNHGSNTNGGESRATARRRG